MTLTKQQKTWGIAGFVGIALYFGPSMILGVRQLMMSQERAAQLRAQPPEPPKVQRQPSAGVTTPDPDVAPFPLSAISGFWSGSAFMPKAGLCTVHLELRENPQAPTHLVGFPSVTCVNPSVFKYAGSAEARSKMNPTTAIMDGKWDKPNLDFAFSIAKSISPDDCPITAFTLTPTGTTVMTSQWQQGSCQGGTIMLQRTNR